MIGDVYVGMKRSKLKKGAVIFLAIIASIAVVGATFLPLLSLLF
jgi:hypothetical protein